ncbi:SAF domain-containing protein [Spirillospora sp. CA-142024]|uniref:SAF domain-containing protein n=1 Tax=Spirillospora sp. CA-142024 TaxID=3240036 RepID=UPI003D8FEC45
MTTLGNRTPRTTGSAKRNAASAAPFKPLPRQRRPAWIVMTASLMLCGAMLNAYLYRSADQRAAVVQLARDVAVGQQLGTADLGVTRVAVDGAVATVPERQLRQVVGKRAAVPLRKGTLLAASQLTAQPGPGRGQALVTVPVKSGLVPPGLAPGWRVQAVFTADKQGSGAAGAAPRGNQRPAASADGEGSVQAVVDQVSAPDSEGAVPVLLRVADSDASALAQQAAAGLVALVVTERLG